MTASAGTCLALVTLGVIWRIAPSATTPVVLLLLIYIAFFAVGLGPAAWLLMSELFPSHIRGIAASTATVALWCACLLVAMTFLSMVTALGASGAFFVYAAVCFGTFVFVWLITPETKGKTLEQIELELRA